MESRVRFAEKRPPTEGFPEAIGLEQASEGIFQDSKQSQCLCDCLSPANGEEAGNTGETDAGDSRDDGPKQELSPWT